MATASASRAYKNFINGEWVAPRSGKTLENRNPGNVDELIGIFPFFFARRCGRGGFRGEGSLQVLASCSGSQARRNSFSRRGASCEAQGGVFPAT